MKFCFRKSFAFLLYLLPLVGFNVCAQLRPAKVFTDHMVLQRDVAIPVWGYAEPGEIVTVTMASNVVRDTTDSSNKWMVKIPSLPAGGPHQMMIQSKLDTIVLEDVLIGEVWFASGQSNMEHALGGWPWIPHSEIENFQQEIKDWDYPQIRMFNVPKLPSPIELTDLKGGTWEMPSESTLPNFSATAWFYAKELNKVLHVPIGIIHSSWGGTAITPWMDRQSLQTFENSIQIPPVPVHSNVETWIGKANKTWSQYTALRKQISNSELDRAPIYSNFSQMGVFWEPLEYITNLGDVSKNWVWLRKEIELPDQFQNTEWCLKLGYLNRQAHVFVNGVELGYFLYPKKSQTIISSHVLKKGKNSILLRVAQPWGTPKVEGQEFHLNSVDGEQQIDLLKNWQILIPEESALPSGKVHSGSTTYLFNGMVAPLIPYAIRGFLWHQGSSDVIRPDFYKEAFPALINGWRKRWGVANAPFIFVQLPNYEPSWNHPGESKSRAPLRLAQAEALGLPNTSMVVSFDIGDPFDVHAANKQDFGHRMALQALSKVYGEDVGADGPKYRSHFVKGDTLIVNFDRVHGNLMSVPKETICGFELAGKDGDFFSAQAYIHGDQIYLTSPKLKGPKEVRYAWSDNPKCFIYNSYGLPLAPFSTDYSISH